MKVILCLALALVAVNAKAINQRTQVLDLNVDSLFAEFKTNFGKIYADEAEEAARLDAFRGNLEFIRKHNAEYEQGLHTYTVGVNQFADMTNEEWRTVRQRSMYNSTRQKDIVVLPEPEAATVDWRTKGAVTPVKNQGQCGSCWSFSTTGSVEGACQIATGKLVSFSEQQLMDCSTAYGNQGCNGGLMDDAFKYIIANGGIDTEADYPYTAQDGTCNKAKEAKHAGSITGFKDVTPDNEAQLAAAVALGPVSVAIEADQQGFQLYKSGVFSGACGHQLDHGVLAVGYTDAYWMVKNSWGTTWGDQGYIYMKRGVSAQGICGIAMQPSYPTAGSGPSPPSPSPPPPPGPSPPPPPSPGPATYHYEDPNTTGSCRTDEEAITIEGLSGNFCSPKCGLLKKCPTDLPPNTTARPECVLETQGSSTPTQCALICNPADANGTGGCPDKASCKSIQGTGLCTYDS